MDRRGDASHDNSGRVAEWSKALVLKTSDGQPSVGSTGARARRNAAACGGGPKGEAA